ncbi:hypothetical protein K2Y11_08310 [bacterium]|nr:hypothetical protein [bacterium]
MADKKFIEGTDYYVENGLVVFTAHYLRERGYCCQSGCRHCPYHFSPQNEDKNRTPVSPKPSGRSTDSFDDRASPE